MAKFVTIGEMVFMREHVVRFQRTTCVEAGLITPHLFVWLGEPCSGVAVAHQPMQCPDPTGELFAQLQRAMEAA